jgi:hypothetical protein
MKTIALPPCSFAFYKSAALINIAWTRFRNVRYHTSLKEVAFLSLRLTVSVVRHVALLTVGNESARRWCGLQWHNVHSEFLGNYSVASEAEYKYMQTHTDIRIS